MTAKYGSIGLLRFSGCKIAGTCFISLSGDFVLGLGDGDFSLLGDFCSNRIKLASLNPRSCRNKTVIINDLVTDHDLDILCLTETWLGKNDDSTVISQIKPSGYDFKQLARNGKTGGGIGLLFKQSLKLDVRTNIPKFDTFEILEVSVCIKGSDFRIVTVYRPDSHGKNTSLFLQEFEPYLVELCTSCSNFIICGDLNFHFDR